MHEFIEALKRDVFDPRQVKLFRTVQDGNPERFTHERRKTGLFEINFKFETASKKCVKQIKLPISRHTF